MSPEEQEEHQYNANGCRLFIWLIILMWAGIFALGYLLFQNA